MFSPDPARVVLFACLPLVGLVLLFTLLWFSVCKFRATGKYRLFDNVEDAKPIHEAVLDMAEIRNLAFDEDVQADETTISEKWIVKAEDLHYEGKIGEGEYGTVLRALLKGSASSNVQKSVAIKRSKPGFSRIHERGLLDEFKVLSKLERHENIVNLIGVVKIPSLMLALEFCPLGSLRNYLINMRDSCNDNRKACSVKQSDLVSYGLQISRAMAHLASNKIIHCDLAARNVLVFTSNIIKVCDFGVIKNCYHYCNVASKANKLLPIKWMALESMVGNVFTEKSNVWSFGVLLWEVFNLGDEPFPGLLLNRSDFNVLVEKLTKGERLSRPYLVPSAIFELMEKCWLKEPASRPDFRQMTRLLESILKDLIYDSYLRTLNHNNSFQYVSSFYNCHPPAGGQLTIQL